MAERILPRSNLSWTSKELVGLAAFKSLEMVLLWNKGTFCRLSELATSWNSCVESEKENVGEKATARRINKRHKQQQRITFKLSYVDKKPPQRLNYNCSFPKRKWCTAFCWHIFITAPMVNACRWAFNHKCLQHMDEKLKLNKTDMHWIVVITVLTHKRMGHSPLYWSIPGRSSGTLEFITAWDSFYYRSRDF